MEPTDIERLHTLLAEHGAYEVLLATARWMAEILAPEMPIVALDVLFPCLRLPVRVQ